MEKQHEQNTGIATKPTKKYFFPCPDAIQETAYFRLPLAVPFLVLH